MKLVVTVFISTLLLFSVLSYCFVDPNLTYLSFLYNGLYQTQKVFITLVYSVMTLILFGCFYLVIQKPDAFRKQLSKIIVLIFLVTIIAYPGILTFDIFNYITTAKVTFFYHENPYVIYPIEFINEPYLDFTRAANKTALYGPMWILFSGIPHFAGFGNFILTLFSFKLFIALFYFATVYLIRKIDQDAVLLFALNPLVIIETLVSSHNDIVMIFLALLTFYIAKNNKVLSVISFFGSILIKFSTVILAPIYLLNLFKEVDQKRLFKFAAILMFVIFLFSPLREELYPWYAVWFVAFTCFFHKNRFLQNLILFFCLGLMLRYIPYMISGTYFGLTPVVRNILMVAPVGCFLIFVWVKRKLNSL